MRPITVFNWIRVLFGAAGMIAGAYFILFFNPGKPTPYKLINENNILLGCGLLVLGFVFILGASGFARVLSGFFFFVLGGYGFIAFLPKRDGWIGQLMTNFFMPFLCLLGIWLMIKFDNDLGPYRRRKLKSD